MPNLQSHTAKAAFFSCIDDRLTEAGHRFIAGLPGGAFHPNLAGGAAAFLSEDDRPTAIKQVVAAYKINGVTDYYLWSHTDCGAYRLAGVTFTSPEAEITRLYADLDQAAQIVHAAVVDAGGDKAEINVHTSVVDPAGHPIPRPQ